jgi:hypothetical protein
VKTPRIAHAATLAALVLAVGLVPTALASKKGGGGGGANSTSSISIASPLVYDANGNGSLNYGDVVLFNVSTTATTQPWVNVKCNKDGATVYNAWNGYFDGALNYNWNFGLASGAWQGGAADCTAYLDMANGRNGWTLLATTSFHVDP